LQVEGQVEYLVVHLSHFHEPLDKAEASWEGHVEFKSGQQLVLKTFNLFFVISVVRDVDEIFDFGTFILLVFGSDKQGSDAE